MANTRQEVEEELEEKWASIAQSISRIKEDLSLPTEPVRSAIKKHPTQVVLGTVAIGLALGLLVGDKRKRRTKNAARPDALPQASAGSDFLTLVRIGRASGLSEEAAVSNALAATASLAARRPVQIRSSLTDRLTGYVVDMAEAMIKTGLRVAVREGAAWLAESVRRDKPEASR
ncbi:MAG TPA: hypothetical protein VGA18_09715 [Rhodothermales bacterium]